MSIEFACSQCGQKLRVGDESAGKRAKCPKCGQINEIPQPAAEAPDEFWDNASLPEVPQTPPGSSPFGAGSQQENPYSAPQASFTMPSAASGMPFAGGKIVNVPTDVGSIVNYAFEVWKENLGLLVGATVVVMVISNGIPYGFGMVNAILQQAGNPEMGAVIAIFGNLLSTAVQLYLNIGLSQIMLKLARRRRSEFSDLFNGGSRFLPVLGVSILFWLAIMGGVLLLIIPGIIIALMWWPCVLLVIDDKSDVMASFGTAREVTRNNMGTTFLVWLVGVGVILLGLLACCIGIIFAQPLVGMMFVVAYLMMSGQIPLQPQLTGGKPAF